MAHTSGIDTSDPVHNRPPAGFDPSAGRRLLGHPPGLFLLFFVEMWERFSYYGMRGLLVLYLIRATTGDEHGFNPGRGWTEGSANTLYGWYTGLAYLFPVLGGILADKFIGTHKSMVLGGIIIALGHIVLAVSGLGDMSHSALGMSVFIGGLALIILGTGHFKPCVSTMVGQLYRQGDAARDGGFSIFYMGINLGAFICAFVCGTLGEQVGWHWGFGSAAVGMIAGLIMYFIGRPSLLRGIGEAPAGRPDISILLFLASLVISAGVGFAYYHGWFGSLSGAIARLGESPMLAKTIIGAGLALVIGATAWFVAAQKPGDKGPTASIFIFMLFNAFFWIAFEQAGSTMNVFAERSTDRAIPWISVEREVPEDATVQPAPATETGSAAPADAARPAAPVKMVTRKVPWEIPATWFQSINAGLIILLAPVFAVLWIALGKRNMNPSQPMKIAWGLILLGLGFIFMVKGAMDAKDGALVSPLWLCAAYLLHTMGELCLSPTGLSYVTKAAPVRFVSLLMGIWFISSFIANLGGGLIAAQVEKVEKGEIEMPWHFGGRADFFMLFVVTSIGAGVLVMIATPLLKKLLRNKND